VELDSGRREQVDQARKWAHERKNETIRDDGLSHEFEDGNLLEASMIVKGG
jgi:hypothetical protein